MGRANERLCETKTGYDECVKLYKEGKVDVCVWTADANARLERKSSTEAEQTLISGGCVKTGTGSFSCPKLQVNRCLGFKGSGAISSCASLALIDLRVSNNQGGEFQDHVKELSTTNTKFALKVTGVPAGAQKIVWKLTGSTGFSTSDWQKPAAFLAGGEVAATVGVTSLSVDLANFLGTATDTSRKFYIHVIAIAGGVPFSDVSRVDINYGKGVSAIKLAPAATGSSQDKTQRVTSSIEVVRYKPPVLNTNECAYILTKTPPNPELKLILEKINVKNIGSKFMLCESDITRIKQNLSLSEKAGLLLQDFLKLLKQGYNYLDSKFNIVENALVDSLAGIAGGKANARKLVNYIKVVNGMSPTYGDFDETIDTGREALKVFIKDSEEIAESEKDNVSAKVDEFANQIKFYANGGGDTNQFARPDPEYRRRPAVVYLRVTYTGINNPPSTMTGGKNTVELTLTSGPVTDTSSLTTGVGNLTYPPVLLFTKKVTIPNATPGKSFLLPVYLDYSSFYKSDLFRWTLGYNSAQPAALSKGGHHSGDVKVIASKEFKK